MAGKARESTDVSSTASDVNGQWEHEKACIVCGSRVTKTPMGSNKRYGCKFCNHAVCSKCSPNRDMHPDTGKSERICNNCFKSKDDLEAKTQMAETIAQASSEIARLETQLQEITQAKQNEEVMRVRKERECEELKGKVFALSCELSAVSDQVHLAELEKVNEDMGRLQDRTKGLERMNEALKSEIDQKKTELISHLTELKEAKSLLIDQKELQVQLKSAQDSLLKATSQTQDLQHSKSTLDTAVATLEEQLRLSQAVASQTQTLQVQVKELESAKNALQSQLIAKERENSGQLAEALHRAKVAENQLEEWEAAKQRADQERTQEERLVTSKIATLQQTVSDFTAAAEEQRHACERKDALIESLEKQVKEANNTLRTASETESTQLTQLRAKVQQAEEHSNRLQRTIDELSLTSKKTTTDLASARIEVSTLTKDKDSLRSQLEALQTDLKSSQNSLEDWRQRCSAAQREMALLSEKLSTSVSALEGSQQIAHTERQRHASEENALKRSFSEELDKNRRQNELQIAALNAEIQTLKDKTATLASTSDALNTVKAAKSKQELELTACQERLRTLEEVQTGLERRYNESLARHKEETEGSAKLLESLREDKLRLTADLAQSGMVAARAEEQRHACERKDALIESLEKQVKEANNTLRTASETESTQLTQLKAKLQQAEEHSNRLQRTIDELSLTSKKTTTDLASARTEVSTLTKDKDSLRSQLEALQTDLKSSQSSLEDWRQRCSEAQRETAVLSDKLSASVSALEIANTERQRHASEENEMKRSLSEELDKNRRQNELQIAALNAEIQTLKDKTATLASTSDALNAVKAAKSKQELELTACQERLRTLEEVQTGLERRYNESLARHKEETEGSAKLLESLREDKLRLTADLAQSGMVAARAEERGKEFAEERDRVGKELEELRLALNRGENEQIRTLVSENKELNQTAKQAIEQKHALESELKGQVQTCKSLQIQLETAQNSLSQARSDLDRVKSLAQDREIEAIRLSQDLTASRDHANRLSAHISDLQQALEAKELEYTAKVRKMSEGGSVEVARLEEQVQSCRLESVRLEEELHKAKLEYARKAHDLEAGNADLRGQLTTSKAAIAALQKDLAEEKATYDRDKATAMELMDSLNLRLKTQSADLNVLEHERTRLQGLLDSTQQNNEELTQHLTQERVSSIKKDKELQKTKKPREVVEDVEDLAILERKADEQDAVVRRLTATRSTVKTMGERELEEQGFGRKRRGSDPSARDACRCAVF